MQSRLKGRIGKLVPMSLGSILNSDWVKRTVDVVGSVVAVILLSPVVIICAVAIRLGGEPDVIFRQERVGRNLKRFGMFKLTTMTRDAHLTGALISTDNDARVTRVGRFIRPARLNELPQFVNVLLGQMSIVGPRPEVAKYVDQWAPEFKEKILSVRPGITGMGTLHFSDEGSYLEGKDDIERAYVEEILPVKLRIDLWYVTHRTLWLDLRIVFLTLLKVLGASRFFGLVPQEMDMVLEERS